MTAKIRSLVSKKKKRYKEDGFNLDLTYIYDNIIAMGFPADKLEGVYRNPIDEVVRFLDSKHYNHYRIYNLCSERHYDWDKFHNRVAEYPFDDHSPPLLEKMREFCEDVDKWLAQDERNVAAIHCKAGKGRTGVMICAYMLHKGLVDNSQSALDYYGKKRTHDNKGVTIPSQKRYVDYYQELVKSNLSYRPVGIILCSIHLQPTPPNFIKQSTSTTNTYFVIYLANDGIEVNRICHSYPNQNQQQQLQQIYDTNDERLQQQPVTIEYTFDDPLYVCGDIKVEFFQHKSKIKKEKLFQFWFNTFFARGNEVREQQNGHSLNSATGPSSSVLGPTNNHSMMPAEQGHPDSQNCSHGGQSASGCSDHLNLVFNKDHLDKAYKDTTHKLYSEDFKVILKFKHAPTPTPTPPPPPPPPPPVL